jgi:succinate dehydrogenase / fumarate reductase cytochrome b subunit
MSLKFLTSYLQSSIGKKQLMALTGLALMGFLFTHLLGNLLIVISPEQFNLYAYKLTSNKLFLYTAEAGLIFLFLMHIGLAIKITIENKIARPVKYHAKGSAGSSTLASRTMPLSGLVILVFLVLHLFQFKFGNHYITQLDGIQMRDMYKTVIEYFDNPIALVWYIFAMFVMAMHVTHGFQSCFQSLGFRHPKYSPIIKKIACAYSLTVGAGFSAIAICCYLKGGI